MFQAVAGGVGAADQAALRGEEQSVVGAAHQVSGDGEREHLGLDGETVGAQCGGDRRGDVAAGGVEPAGAQLDDRTVGDLGQRAQEAGRGPGILYGGGTRGGRRFGGDPDAEHRGALPRRRAQCRQHPVGVRGGGVEVRPAGIERGFRAGELGAGAVRDAADDRQDGGGGAAFGPQAHLGGEGGAERSGVQRDPADAVLGGEAGRGRRDGAQMRVLGGVADHDVGRALAQCRGHRAGAPFHHVQGQFGRAAPALGAQYGRDPGMPDRVERVVGHGRTGQRYAVDEMQTAHRGPAGVGEGGDGQGPDPGRGLAGGEGIHHRVEFAAGIAAQGGVDALDDQRRRTRGFGGGPDGRVGAGGAPVARGGVDDEDVHPVRIARDAVEVADGDGPQALSRIERTGRIAAGEVVSDDEHLGHPVSSRRLRCRHRPRSDRTTHFLLRGSCNSE
ncbi:hypothetical protein Srufu_003080 [Streptomyces libani subsp. rufus]|nr:hypothetical protein Srufu_003080 [Streptomyces libani subsp. rufus]